MSTATRGFGLIDAVLYQHLVTGNSDGFIEIISSRQLDVLKLRHTKDKNTVLHIAASFGQVHLVTHILSHYSSLMLQRNSQGDLPIHSALKTGELNAVEALTRWLQLQPNSDIADQVLAWNINGKSNTPLHIALELYDDEHLPLILDLVDLYPRASYVMNKEGICPLYLAIKKEYAELVHHMRRKLHPFKQDALDCLRNGKSVLHAAVSSRRTEILEDILSFDDANLIKSMDKQGRTALSYAGYMGFVEQVQVLLTVIPHSAFISNKDKSFPIHQAVLGGHISVINLLASSRFLLNSRGQNILHVAVLAANFALVSHLLNLVDFGSLINQKDKEGNTPLHLAKKLTSASQGNIVVHRLERAAKGLKSFPIDGRLYGLLAHGEIDQVCRIVSDEMFSLKDLEWQEDGCNVLHIAASMDRPLLVVEVLRRECDILMKQANHKGDLPIHSAAKAGQLRSLRALCEWQDIFMDVCKSMNDKGNTALHIAVLNKQGNMAKFLYNQCPLAAYYLNKDNVCPLFLAIKMWGESDLVDSMINGLEGNTQLQTDLKSAKSVVHMAIFTRKSATLKSIIEKAPGLMDSFDSRGRNPLSYAAHIGYVEGVKLLLERFPELQFKRDLDKDGSFPIHQAAKGGLLKVIKLRHPKICLLNSMHQNILHVAAKTGRAKIVKFLLKMQQFKELVNTGDDCGNTPLHLAAKGAHYRIVYELTLGKLSDGNLTNNELLTPRDIFEMRLQYPYQNFHSRNQINVMDLMMQRVDGGNSLLRERIGQMNNLREKEIKRTKATNDSIGSSDGKLRLTSRERANTLLVVAMLIITVSFAAAFTPPGGYKEANGLPALISTSAFRVFILCNGFAFLFAVGSALTLILGMNVERLAGITLFIGGIHIYFGILWMTIAFLAGSIDVQILSLLKPRDKKWMWLIIRRTVEILVMPIVPLLFFLCRKFKGLSELRIRYFLLFCLEEEAQLDFSI